MIPIEINARPAPIVATHHQRCFDKSNILNKDNSGIPGLLATKRKAMGFCKECSQSSITYHVKGLGQCHTAYTSRRTDCKCGHALFWTRDWHQIDQFQSFARLMVKKERKPDYSIYYREQKERPIRNGVEILIPKYDCTHCSDRKQIRLWVAHGRFTYCEIRPCPHCQPRSREAATFVRARQGGRQIK